MTDYNDELVDRCAPRWAWDIIDETLANDAKSKAFDAETREQVRKAYEGMIYACGEGDQITHLSPEDPVLNEESESDEEPDFDPENIYGLPGIRQSIEEDRK